jgi:hypothetical protein
MVAGTVEQVSRKLTNTQGQPWQLRFDTGNEIAAGEEAENCWDRERRVKLKQQLMCSEGYFPTCIFEELLKNLRNMR